MGLIPFLRPEFLDCLADKLPHERAHVHFGKRLVSYSVSPQSNPLITLQFKDGSTAKCDVLVGADGVHSATRKSLLEFAAHDLEANQGDVDAATSLREKIEPVWTGYTAYRTVANAAKLRALNPNHSVLTGPHMVSWRYNICLLGNSLSVV